MKKSIALVIAVLALSWINVRAMGPDVYGEGVSGTETVPISRILASPERYEGRTVRVKGKVVDVCRHQGCWLQLREPSGSEIQLKVDDGVIVFPVSAVGKQALVEGKVEVRDLSREQYVQMLQHRAEEQGREFDPSQVGPPPYRFIRIKGTGAEIED